MAAMAVAVLVIGHRISTLQGKARKEERQALEEQSKRKDAEITTANIIASNAQAKAKAAEEMAKPKPFDERLRALLEATDPKILRELAKGGTRFVGGMKYDLFGDLKKLIAEPLSTQFITIIPEETGTVGFGGREGPTIRVGFELSPNLLKQNAPPK